MRYKIGSIVLGKVSADLSGFINKPLDVSFIGKVSSYDEKTDVYKFDELVITDLERCWNNIEGGIEEYGNCIVRLCTPNEFDIFYDNMKSPPITLTQYWTIVGATLRLILQNNMED